MYCTLEDLKNTIPEIMLVHASNDEGTGTVNEGRINEAIAQADAEIDAYCRKQYTVPFSTVPAMIKTISIAIVIYRLYCRKVEAISETRATQYKNALRQLHDIVDGTISLDTSLTSGFSTGLIISDHFEL